ncbi:MAG TPA: hypothetical protein VEO74_09930 [Thermoanaerobaculia bacterium]|nr:hypothetical protein [Thermoanaerobaculia bacterium]
MTDDLRARFAELRDEESRTIPKFAVVAPASRRPYWRRPAAAFAFLLLVIVIASIHPRRKPTFTPDDRAAARAIATWHPPTDFLLRMPSTGVSR